MDTKQSNLENVVERFDNQVTLDTIHEDIKKLIVQLDSSDGMMEMLTKRILESSKASSCLSERMIVLAIGSLFIGFASITISVVNSVRTFGFDEFTLSLIIADCICFIFVVILLVMMIRNNKKMKKTMQIKRSR